MSEAPDYRIDVTTETHYIAEQSAPDDGRYAFTYTITIENHGTLAAQLISRRWLITDANGRIQQVEGDGVVGEQPYLAPGEQFRYTSGTLLGTEVGTMQGSYQMVAADGHHFDAPIAPFTLAAPRILH